MTPIELKIKPLSYVMDLVAVLCTFGLLLPVIFIRWRNSAKTFDKEGVTRGDGKKLLWANLRKIDFNYRRGRYSAEQRLSTVDLNFTDGKTFFSLQQLVNQKEAMEFIAFLAAKTPREG